MKVKNLNKEVQKTYYNVTGSIAFYPTLMSLVFFVFALLIMSIEYTEPVMKIKRLISIVLVNGDDNARLILNTLIGGVFSLTVFSFSMVMIVLNRATATLSPRVIPGLITQKSHQFVLGFYLGTIIYSLMLTININAPEMETGVPGLGILLSLCFGIASLALFVYFIHSISRTIQVDNILNSLYKSTRKEMEKLHQKRKEFEEEIHMPDSSDWYTINARTSGYFKMVEAARLCEVLNDHDLELQVKVPHGFFVVEGYPFLKVSREVDGELEEKILGNFVFFVEEYVKDHYSYGFKQISEIAVKALSPGINDPGTAVKAIDQLTILFKYKMEHDILDYETDSEGAVRVFYNGLTLDELFFKTITPIRAYGKEDALVVINLLESLKNLLFTRCSESQEDLLIEYAEGIVDDARKSAFNQVDVRKINDMVCKINDLLQTDHTLKEIEA